MDHPSLLRHQSDAVYKSPENDGGGVMVPTEVCWYNHSPPLLSQSMIRRWFGECLLLVTYTLIKNLTRRKSTSERSLLSTRNKRHYIFISLKLFSLQSQARLIGTLLQLVTGCSSIGLPKSYWRRTHDKNSPRRAKEIILVTKPLFVTNRV